MERPKESTKILSRLIEGASLKSGFKWDLNYEIIKNCRNITNALKTISNFSHFISNLND